MRPAAKILKAGAAVCLLSAAVFLASGGAALPCPPQAWDIRMTITVQGEYALEGRDGASGRYGMRFVWTGGLEPDDEDYILIQRGTKLEEWRVEESAVGPDGIRLLTTRDYGVKPELGVAYILRKDGGLHLNFLIRGFEVPRSRPSEAFYLHLPASAENTDRPEGLNYALFLQKGSNAIVLDDPAASRKTQEKSFHWTWFRRSGVLGRDPALFQMNRHEADVTVVVTPRADSGPRTGQARG